MIIISYQTSFLDIYAYHVYPVVLNKHTIFQRSQQTASSFPYLIRDRKATVQNPKYDTKRFS